MSQTDTADVSGESDDNTVEVDSVTERVAAACEALEALGDDQVAQLDDVDLVELRTEVKDLEDTVSDVRKEQVDSEVETRIAPGESMYGLRRIESHNKFVKDSVGTVIGRMANRGMNYTEYVSLDASALAELDDEIAEIGRYEYTYLR